MERATIGERLRRAREEIPASLHQVARETRIRVDFIQAMERDSFKFVGAAYVKGMLRAYSRWLALDEEDLASEFDRVHGGVRGPTLKQIFREPAQRPPRRRSPRWMIAAAIAAGTLMVLSLVGVMNPPGPQRVASPPSAPSAESSLPSQSLAQVPSIEGVLVTVTVIGEKCWMRVLSDSNGDPVFEGNLYKGTVQTFRAGDRLDVLFGNLGAIVVQVNGRDLGSPGLSGQTGRFIFRSDTSSFTRASSA